MRYFSAWEAMEVGVLKMVEVSQDRICCVR